MRSEMQVVKGGKNSAEKPERRKFSSGEAVPTSGIYKVTHAEHRLPHEVTVLSGQIFPPCAKCGNAVIFRLLRVIQDSDTPFTITLHQIPEIEAPAEPAAEENVG